MSTSSRLAPLGAALALLACARVERPPSDWPAPDPGTPAEFIELVEACRDAARRRARHTNHAIRAEQVLAWAGGLSVAGGVVTATLAGVSPSEREGILGTALVGTLAAGVALGARFVADSEDARRDYERARAQELAASRDLWELGEVRARLRVARPGSPEHDALRRREAELRRDLHVELLRCASPLRSRLGG